MTLSHGGLAALIPTDLKVGDAVELYFSLPYPVAHVLAEAVVRGRDGYRYGFEFVRLNPSDQRMIDAACDSLLP